MKVKTHVKAGGAGYGCKTDADCNINGQCGKCECIEGVGGRCAFG